MNGKGVPLLLALFAALMPGRACHGSLQRSAPTLAELSGATFVNIEEVPVTLHRGVWEGAPFMADGASRPRVELLRDFLLHGDLDGDSIEEAAVLLRRNAGGTGVGLYLAVVARREGALRNIATVYLGDRTRLRRGELRSGELRLDLVQAGPGDPSCCPSRLITRSWISDGASLKERQQAATGTLHPGLLGEHVWELRQVDGKTLPADGPVPTLRFDQGRFIGNGGCNRYFARVKQKEPAGAIEVGPVGGTKMACPGRAGEVERQFFKALGATVRFRFQAGSLALDWQEGDRFGTMLFAPAP